MPRATGSALHHGGRSSALHHAAALNDLTLMTALLAAGASPSMRTQDDPNRGVPGGRAPLHAAAAAGAADTCATLCAVAPIIAATPDWEGRLPAELAWLSGAHALALRLADSAVAAAAYAVAASSAAGAGGDPNMRLVATPAEVEERLEEVRQAEADDSDRQLARTVRRVELRERRREALAIERRPALQQLHLLRGAWSAEQCARLLSAARDAAAFHGWSTGRHKFAPTTDMPLWRVDGATAAWTRTALEREALPALASAYGLPRCRLALREAFIALYDADGSGQRALEMHRDGTLLACTLLLNSPRDFEGGGTCFATPQPLHDWAANDWRADGWADSVRGAVAAVETHTVTPEAGDMLLQCGQLKHGSRPVMRGQRYILICFVDELLDEPGSRVTADDGGDDTMGHEDQASHKSCPKSTPPLSPQAVPPLGIVDSELAQAEASASRLSSACDSSAGGSCAGSSSLGASAGEPQPASCKTRRRTTGSTPGSRRLISFGTMDDPAAAAPERRGRYTLPGGKPAFAPGWDEPPEGATDL